MSPSTDKSSGTARSGSGHAALFLPCAAGTESLLADECIRLLGMGGSTVVDTARGGSTVVDTARGGSTVVDTARGGSTVVDTARGGSTVVDTARGGSTVVDTARGGSTVVDTARGGVVAHGDAIAAMRLNLHSRLAQRVLWPLAHGPYADEQDLYALARSVPWGDWITPQQTFRIDTAAQRSPLRSLNFATLRVKDAVCDVLRDATGERPSIDTRWPDLPLTLFLSPTHATLYADTSGEALFKRGWRDAKGGRQDVKGEAPLKETLAAAMLAAAGWQGRAEDGALFDPCCGAGTIAIEAAQIACAVAPGLQRRFAFEKMLPFRSHQHAWQRLKTEARTLQRPPAVPIFAGDVSFRMTDFATRNAARAGVQHAIEFKTADALQRLPPCERGTMVVNPPYGERIDPRGSRGGERIDPHGSRGGERIDPHGSPGGERSASREGFEGGASPAEFFSQLATHWKRHYAGWTSWVLSPDMKLPQALRLKESRRVPMWNGPIECRLFRFDLVAGSARDKTSPQAPAGMPPDTQPAPTEDSPGAPPFTSA